MSEVYKNWFSDINKKCAQRESGLEKYSWNLKDQNEELAHWLTLMITNPDSVRREVVKEFTERGSYGTKYQIIRIGNFHILTHDGECFDVYRDFDEANSQLDIIVMYDDPDYNNFDS